MARSRAYDPIQGYRFHLLDAGVLDELVPVLNPLAGFKSVSVPELSVEVQDVADGTGRFPVGFVSGVSVSNITLSRGVTFFSSGFWEWIVSVINGRSVALEELPGLSGKRRDLVLILFSDVRVGSADVPDWLAGIVEALSFGSLGADIAGGYVPARVWFLQGCLPVRYKPASDFDAGSSEVLLEELELKLTAFEELSVAV